MERQQCIIMEMLQVISPSLFAIFLLLGESESEAQKKC
jgi:hypothetical protein